jgi:transposase-like protein
VLSRTSMQSWTLTCPICGEENQVITKQIVAAEPS